MNFSTQFEENKSWQNGNDITLLELINWIGASSKPVSATENDGVLEVQFGSRLLCEEVNVYRLKPKAA
jgi:hypothetical protein